jgi:HEAT repeat protein
VLDVRWPRFSPRLWSGLFVIMLAAASLSARQQATPNAIQPGMLPGLAVELTNGWALFAEGSLDRAGVIASRVLANYPQHPAVVAFAIEVDITRGGAMTALATYEQWLGTRKDEPIFLRRIASALLAWFARPGIESSVRVEALKALVADGDPTARAAIVDSAKAGNEGDLRGLAQLGNASAIDQFVARMRATKGPKWRDLAVLGETKSPRVLTPLIDVLSDPDPQNQQAAIDALGRLGLPEAVPHLRPLLKDPRSGIRTSAAGALFRLGDVSGASILYDMTRHEEASVRMSAASFLASQPDAAWRRLVQSLVTDNDPIIRLDAARLLAREDPDAARAMFDTLLNDPNPVIREEAGVAEARTVSSDLAVLRRLLRHPSELVRVHAANRVLEITR